MIILLQDSVSFLIVLALFFIFRFLRDKYSKKKNQEDGFLFDIFWTISNIFGIIGMIIVFHLLSAFVEGKIAM